MSLINSIAQMRRDYARDLLEIDKLRKNPYEQFTIWFEDAAKADFLEPNSMALATADASGRPSIRMVLLKKYDERGFVFFTNFESRKGREIEENPRASLLFYWDKLERQIRINGKVERISPEESDEYFQTRDYTSRLGAWASKQSSELRSRFTLLRSVANLIAKYPKKVPLPPHWGGYRLTPVQFEFWQGRESRLHDRFQYNANETGWRIIRLYP